ncbi:MAG: tetratricopeptide repeat protein [Hyphomonadaceae bacterium]
MRSRSEAAAVANASRELLSKGDIEGAEKLLGPVFNDLRGDPSVVHLMGLIKQARNQLEEAERLFRAAIAHALEEPGYYNDLGIVLQARGEFAEACRVFRACIALRPKSPGARINLVRCLIAAGDLAEAEREARAFIAAAPSAEAWTLLSQVQRAMERNEDALVAAEKALGFSPNARSLRYSYAVALERVGRGAEAVEVLEKLARQEVDSPELAVHFARALYAHGRKTDSEIVLEEGLKRWPASQGLHQALARVLALRGEGDNASRFMDAEIARNRTDLTLRLACADSLHRDGRHAKALAVLDEALTIVPHAPGLLTARAVVLDELDRTDEALTALRRVIEMTPSARSAQRNLLSVLLRAQRPDEALAVARALRAAEPDEQYLLACEATALRMLGDPAYRQLCDYERYVRSYDVSPPRGYFTMQSFNDALAETLRTQHRVNAHPWDQHIHAGAQTGRSLLPLDEMRSFLSAVDACVRDYISRLKPDEPIGRRRRERHAFSALWSVRLGRGGFQPNHVHDNSWISSAYLVAVSPDERPQEPKSGQLKFGEPNRPIAGCRPELFPGAEVGPAGAVSRLFLAWHRAVRGRGGAPERRLRRDARLKSTLRAGHGQDRSRNRSGGQGHALSRAL